MSAREKAFWHIHKGLPRQAPGSDASTRRLLELAKLPRTNMSIIDIGCGPGRSALVLAKNGFSVTAIDTSSLLLDELRSSVDAEELGNSITIESASMFESPYSDSSFDIIWSEGAAYIAGWESAIRSWQRLLRPGGKMILTECCWLTSMPSAATRHFWSKGYPTMLTVQQAITLAQKNKLTVEATYILPDSDWWNEYYTPIERRLEEHGGSSDPALQEIIFAEKQEIELRKSYPTEYGYVGFVLSRAAELGVST